MPTGLSPPYSASMTTPVTIVGSANGTSMTDSSTPAPRKRSRTSTQATSTPMTAFTAATPGRQAERQAQGGRGLPVGDRSREAVPAEVEGLADHRDERDQHQQADPQHDDAERRTGDARAAAPRCARAAAGAPLVLRAPAVR